MKLDSTAAPASAPAREPSAPPPARTDRAGRRDLLLFLILVALVAQTALFMRAERERSHLAQEQAAMRAAILAGAERAIAVGSDLRAKFNEADALLPVEDRERIARRQFREDVLTRLDVLLKLQAR